MEVNVFRDSGGWAIDRAYKGSTLVTILVYFRWQFSVGVFGFLTFSPSATFSGILCCILNKSIVSLTVLVWFKVKFEESLWWHFSLFNCLFASFM